MGRTLGKIEMGIVMRARKEAGKLRGYADQVLRDRKLSSPPGKFKERLGIATRILTQGG